MFRIFALLALAVALLGCASPNKQLVQIQQDKDQLLAAIRDQRDKNRQLTDQVASLETRLGQAEKELARAGSGTRISTRPNTPLPAAPAQPLPWRAPADKPPASPPAGSKMSGPPKRAASADLAALAARDSRLEYDSRRGEAQLAAPLSFDETTGSLTAASKRELDQVSKLLRSEEARNLQITVSAPGGAQHAQAVADYLDRHGIPQERLSVAALSGLGESATSRNAPSEVRITLSEAGRPLRR